MTWLIKHTRSPGSRIAAEYECPAHGRFEATMDREESGDPPGSAFCPHEIDMITDSGRPRRFRHRCGRASLHVISAPLTRVQRVTAARRGKDPEMPPNCMDWRAAAYDECSPAEWEAKERKKDWEATRKVVKDALR